ncbi:MAG TPA: hypothetical protein VGM54_01780 [Chthoniobacter sp.]|jgi:hypothetical protein
MIGDAYFQFRAQIGTGLFSLLRLAAESGAREETQAALLGMQNRLRETFTFAALGTEEAGRCALLNALFEREFCGATAEPITAGRAAIYHYGEEANDTILSDTVIECRRPHSFLRDFAIVDAPGTIPAGILTRVMGRADLIFYVLGSGGATAEVWHSLSHLGRDLLKRLVFVVWQWERVSADESANSLKRLRQAMLRNLGQACPIFTGSKVDSSGREKLERWIETEVILSAARRGRLREIDAVAQDTLREIVAKPRAERQALDLKIDRVKQMRGELDEWREQLHRQVAGTLWTLAQTFDEMRRGGEDLLRTQLRLSDLFWKRAISPQQFAQEIEAHVHGSFSLHLHDQLVVLEEDLLETAMEHLRGSPGETPNDSAKPAKLPEFPRAAVEETLANLDAPLDAARVVDEAYTGAVQLLQLPALAAAGAAAMAIGAAVAGQPSPKLAILAGAVCVFAIVLGMLLRRNIIAAFGRHFTANRAIMLSAVEPALRSAGEKFFTGFDPAIESRAEELSAERARGEPLLSRLQQIEETFSRIESDLRAGLTREPPSGGESP